MEKFRSQMSVERVQELELIPVVAAVAQQEFPQ